MSAGGYFRIQEKQNIRLLADVPGDWKEKITLLILATHMSGLPGIPDNFEETIIDKDDPYKNYKEKDLYKFLSEYKITSKIEERFEYSNLGFGLLGHKHDALSIIDFYKLPKVHAVGHSMGGDIAQMMAIDYQERVLSLTLLSSSILENIELNKEKPQILSGTWTTMFKNKPTKNYKESVNGFLEIYKIHNAKFIEITDMGNMIFNKNVLEYVKNEIVSFIARRS